MKSLLKVYLAGLISTNWPQSLEWRTMLIDSCRLTMCPLRFVSPLVSKNDLVGKSQDGGLTHPDYTSGDILHRDFLCVSDSDVILANLNTWGNSRPMVGTWCELAWAWEHHKPIIGVSHPDDPGHNLARNHPFVSAFVDHWFPVPEQAAEFIIHYYSSI